MLKTNAGLLKGKPLVSVVVPCYNYAHFLRDAVASALDQPRVDVEVIVVDDASTDSSATVASSLAAEDGRVTVVRHEHNQGHIATYNDGLSRVNGELVVLLSADDVLAEGSLERSAALFEARPDVGLVYGFAPSFTGGPLPVATAPKPAWTIWNGEEWLRRVCRKGNNFIVNPEAVVRRSVVDAIGGYDPNQPHAADMYFWLRAATLGAVGRINGVEQAYYRVHGDNMHLSAHEGQYRDVIERRRVFETLLCECVIDQSLYSTAMRALAKESLWAARMALVSSDADRKEHANQFERFACESDPNIRHDVFWSIYRILGGSTSVGPAGNAQAYVDRVRWNIAMRRWRRAGA